MGHRPSRGRRRDGDSKETEDESRGSPSGSERSPTEAGRTDRFDRAGTTSDTAGTNSWVRRSPTDRGGPAERGGGDATGGHVGYDPGPDREALGRRIGIHVRGGQARTLRRLEDEFGTDRVSRWADEGMTVETMGKPRDVEAFRKRQADRPDDVPADVERRNEASVRRNAAADRDDGPAGQAGVPDVVRRVVSSPGTAMDDAVRREMEAKVGGDFGDVRVHAGPEATAAADAIGARAFAVGNHVAFGRGEYRPDTAEGRGVLAHELTHVRQRTPGAVSLLPKAGVDRPAGPRGEHSTAGSRGARLHVQPKLVVGSPDDPAEREAEEVAKRVVEMDPPSEGAPDGDDRHRAAAVDVALSESANRSRRGVAVPDGVESAVRGGVRGGGKPLAPDARAEFEAKMGADFSDVRIHTGAPADEAASSIGASAFTKGSDVAFAKGEYDPASAEGRRLIAHELTHVLQQRSPGSVDRQQQSTDDEDSDATADGIPGVLGELLDALGAGTGGGNSAIVSAAESRAQGDIGDAYDWSPGWWYTPNPNLAGARSEPHDWEKDQGASLDDKDDEYIVNWGGGQPTCNVYVYDVLYQAGESPPMQSNDHYPDAGACHEGAGGYLTRISRSEIRPGDVFTNGAHMEIITSVSNGGQSFASHGAHSDGAYEMDPSRYASASGLRFWRV